MLGLLALSACVGDKPTGPDTSILAAKGGGGGGPKITGAEPSSAPQDTTLDIRVIGSGFEDGSVVKLLLAGNSTPKVLTKSTRFVDGNNLIATITIAVDAEIALYDIEVTPPRGRPGVGSELFSVQKKGKPGEDEGPEVTTTDLGTIEGTTSSSAVAVSDNGSYVVGRSGLRASIVMPGSQMIELPVVFDPDLNLKRRSRANDVNNTGQAVGSRLVDRSPEPSVLMAVFWDAVGQTGIELADINDFFSEARGINNSGVIVGRTSTSRGVDNQGNPLPRTNHAMRWTVDAQGRVTQLDLHSAWAGTERPDQSVALDINDRGQILMRDNNVVGEYFLVDCGMPFDLANCTSIAIEPARGGYSAFAINNADPVQVVGVSDLGPVLSTVGGGSIELPPPNGFDVGGPKGLNDEGLVVGSASNSKGARAAVLWRVDENGSAVAFAFVLGDNVAVDLANSAIGELARVVGDGKGSKKFRKQNVARMWELIVPGG